MKKTVMFLVLTVALFGMSHGSVAAPIADGSVSFDDSTGQYTYEYVVSGVDPGRKVTGINWMVIEGLGAPQPEYLPSSWTVPFFWSFLPGHDGPIPGGAWLSSTGASEGNNVFPIDPTWGILLSGQTRTFSFTTGYAPREGTYFLVENAEGSEVGYQFLAGTTVIPDYDGSIPETLWSGQDTFNRPAGFPDTKTVPEPSTFLLVAFGVGGSLLLRSIKSIIQASPV